MEAVGLLGGLGPHLVEVDPRRPAVVHQHLAARGIDP